jgi:hypothetical protein
MYVDPVRVDYHPTANSALTGSRFIFDSDPVALPPAIEFVRYADGRED